MHDNERYFFEALRAGASGYVLKSVVDRDLIEACRATMRGEPFIYPGAVRALVREYLRGVAPSGRSCVEDPLSPRETEVVKLIVRGATTERSQAPWSSAKRQSSATVATSWRSSACAIASS